MIVSRDPDWLQNSINVMLGLYQGYGLADNIAKYRSMMYQPGALRSRMSAEAKALK